MKVLRRLSPGFTHAVEMHMVSLTHMLALVDSEQEQLLLLDLGLGWLEDFQAKGTFFKHQPGNSRSTLMRLFTGLEAEKLLEYYSCIHIRNIRGYLLSAQVSKFP